MNISCLRCLYIAAIIGLLSMSHTAVGQSKAAEDIFMNGKEAFEEHLYIEAIVQFTDALSVFTDYALAYDYRGRSYMGIGNTSRAIEDFEKSLILSPELMPPKINLMKLYENKGDFKSGIRIANLMMQHNPDNRFPALMNRSDYYVALGELSKARTDLIELLQNEDPYYDQFIPQIKQKLDKLND